jgi:hypothetical protein
MKYNIIGIGGAGRWRGVAIGGSDSVSIDAAGILVVSIKINIINQ